MATFYVDANNGDDANTGMAPDRAWGSLERVNDQVLKPSDVVLLRAGDVHHTTLSPTGSGTAIEPITFGRYGEGPSPVLSGLRDLTAVSWVEVDGEIGIWRTDLVTTDAKGPEKLLLGGQAWSPRAASLGAVERPGDWFWESGQLYLQADAPPGLAYGSVEVPFLEQAIRVKGGDFLRFENLEIVGAVQGVLIDGSTGIVLANLDIHHNTRNGVHLREANGTLVTGGSAYANGIDGVGERETHLGHGILVGRGSQDNVIEDVVLYGNAEDGVQFGPRSGDDNVVRSSLIFGNREDGIDIKQGSQNVFANCVIGNAENAVLVHNGADQLVLSGNVLATRSGGNALDVSDGARVVSQGNWYQGAASYTLQLHSTAGDRSEFSGDVFFGGGKNSGTGVVLGGGFGHQFESVVFAADGIDHLLWLRQSGSAIIANSVMYGTDSSLLRLDEGVELTLVGNLYASNLEFLGRLRSRGNWEAGDTGSLALALDGEGRMVSAPMLSDEGRWPVHPPIDCPLPDGLPTAAERHDPSGLVEPADTGNGLVFVIGDRQLAMASCTTGHDCHTQMACSDPFNLVQCALGDC